MKDRNMLSYIEFYTLKRCGYYYSSFNKQERGASLDYLSNIPLACILHCNKNKALCRFSYILKKVVKMVVFWFFFSTKKELIILFSFIKDLTKLILNFCNNKTRQIFTNKSLSFEKLKKFKLHCSR